MHRGGSFADLLALDDVDALISLHGLRAPALRLVRDGKPLAASAFTRSGRIGSRPVTDLIHPGRVLHAFGAGATIVLQGLHRFWEPLTRFCRDLEAELQHPVQANAYITPPGSSGLRVHADPHDVFALQAAGAKHWLVYKPGDDDGTGDPLVDHTMCPGDALYLPRGTPHAPRTLDTTSVHITVGIRPVTWRAALERAIARTLEDERFGAALPPCYAARPELAEEAADTLLAVLRDRLTSVDGATVVTDAAARFRAGRQALLDGQLRQLVDLDRIDDDTWLRSRDRIGEVTIVGDQVRIGLGDRALWLPAAVEPAVRRLLDGSSVQLVALEPWLDAEGRIVLARRLVREGALIAAHAHGSS